VDCNVSATLRRQPASDAPAPETTGGQPSPEQDRPHAEKLSDVGARIACIAHELNAPVSLIAGSLENVEHYFDALIRYIHATDEHIRANPRLAELRAQPEIEYVLENTPVLLRICADGAQRLTHLVQQLKGYTRRAEGTTHSDAVDLAALLNAAVGLAAHGRERLPAIVREFADLPPLQGAKHSST
jgi:signal transduction histidine kinase